MKARFVFLCAFLAAGCVDDGKAEFRLSANNSDSCLAGKFPFSPEQIAVTRKEDYGAFVSFESRYRKDRILDFFLITLSKTNPATAEPCPLPAEYVGQSVEVGPNTCVRVTAQFASCREEFRSYLLRGTVRFDRLSYKKHGRIDGNMSGQLVEKIKVIVDDTVKVEYREVGALSGDFNVRVYRSGSYQKFFEGND